MGTKIVHWGYEGTMGKNMDTGTVAFYGSLI